jgi:hypothetical protein
MARIVEHIEGRPVVTTVPDSLMQVHRQNVASGMIPVSTLRMSTGCVMVDYRTSKGMRTLYIWP